MKNKLRQIITDYGLKILEEPKRLEAIINDLLITESKSDLFAIKLPLQQGLVNELKNKGKDFIHLFKHKLINDFCITEEKAIFTTEIWVFALFNEDAKINNTIKIEPNNKENIIKPNIVQLQIINPTNNYEPEMVFVEGGTFMMGSNEYENEKPIHRVTVNSFYIGKYQITQKKWFEIMGNNPSHFKGDNLPVEQVSWNDVKNFLTKLNIKTGKNYRLPTEAEWEYAARGGNKSKGYKYAGSNNIDDVAWYNVNSSGNTHPVGTKKSNELGIYDMSGNVREWCQDWYDENYYRISPNNNPKGPDKGTICVLRGGSWFNYGFNCRSANRGRSYPNNGFDFIGFRLVLD